MRKTKKLLPIGTVVEINNYPESFIIIQNRIYNEDGQEKYDYIGITYPSNSRITKNIKQEDIKKIISLGKIDTKIKERTSKKKEVK